MPSVNGLLDLIPLHISVVLLCTDVKIPADMFDSL